MGRVVLVTGVSRHVGGVLARALVSDPDVEHVVGVDVIPPPRDLGGARFARADIRNPMIGRIIADNDVDTVVHANVIATPTAAGGRAPQKEINVIGTMQLLAACQKADTVRRLVVKSSAAVYGSTARDPAMFTEEMSPKRLPDSGFGKDSIEVEGYVRGFARRRPDIDIVTLRLANIVGPRIRTTITDYFSMPVVPVPLGFDARLQFIHEDDAVAAIVRSTTGSVTGVINLAGDGVLTVLQCAALAGRPFVMVPMAASASVASVTRKLGLTDFNADQMGFLAFGRGLDTTAMREQLGFEPTYTTRTAFEAFTATLSPAVASPARVGAAAQNAATAATAAWSLVRKAVS